jgi:hypothetical protein
MELKASQFYRRIGTIIRVQKGPLSEGEIPSGTYIIMEHSSDFDTFYDIKEGTISQGFIDTCDEYDTDTDTVTDVGDVGDSDTVSSELELEPEQIIDREKECDTVYVMYADIEERLQFMYEGYTVYMLQLLAEGWTPDSEFMDLSPVLEKMKVLQDLVDDKNRRTR